MRREHDLLAILDGVVGLERLVGKHIEPSAGQVPGVESRGEGVEIDDGKGTGKTVGVPASCLRAVGKSAAQAFKIGDEVQVVSDNPAQCNGHDGKDTWKRRLGNHNHFVEGDLRES